MSEETVNETAPEQPVTAGPQTAPEQPVTEEHPVTEEYPVTEEQPAAPKQPSAARRRLLRATGATVAAALVGVAIGVGIIEVGYDDPAPAAAAAPAPTAKPVPTAKPTPFGAKSNGNHFGSLRDLLLPVPAGFAPGPDAGGYGNDDELGAEQLKTELEEDLKDVPKEKRDQLRAIWEGMHFKATGVRTFKDNGNGLVVTLKLRQFNQQEVQKMNEYTAVFTGDTGLFRIGPEVPGHPEAHCYLMPAPPSAPIDYLECSAAAGDLLVLMEVEGVAPLPKDKIVAIFTQQLDRLATPGASA